jgi:hypothetical protein
VLSYLPDEDPPIVKDDLSSQSAKSPVSSIPATKSEPDPSFDEPPVTK